MTTSIVDTATVETTENAQSTTYQVKSIKYELKSDMMSEQEILCKIANNEELSMEEQTLIAHYVVSNAKINVLNPEKSHSRRGKKPTPESIQKNINDCKEYIQKKEEYIQKKETEYDSIKNKTSERAIKTMVSIGIAKQHIEKRKADIDELEVKLYQMLSPLDDVA